MIPLKFLKFFSFHIWTTQKLSCIYEIDLNDYCKYTMNNKIRIETHPFFNLIYEKKANGKAYFIWVAWKKYALELTHNCIQQIKLGGKREGEKKHQLPLHIQGAHIYLRTQSVYSTYQYIYTFTYIYWV